MAVLSLKRTNNQSKPQSGWHLSICRLLISTLLFALAMGMAPRSHAQASADNNASPASYTALADLLENEKTRKQLVTQLRALAAPAANGQMAQDGSKNAPDNKAANKNAADKNVPASAEEGSVLFSRDIADGIEHFVISVSADLSGAAATFRALNHDDDVARVSRRQLLSSLQDFALVVVATLLAFFVFRAIAARFYARSNAWVTAGDKAAPAEAAAAHDARFIHSGLYRKSIAIVAAMIADTAAILLAGAIGYVTGLFAVGQADTIGTLESLFVNTFVAVEIARAFARAVFAPRYDRLRLFEMDDDIAAYWGHWLERLIGLTGYGILVGVPLAKAMLSPTIGHMLGILIMLGVYIYAVRIIWLNRTSVRERMERYSEHSSTAFFSTLIRILARIWHALAIAYFTALLVVSQVDPHDALPFMAQATLQTLVAIGLGLLLSAIVGAALARRITLSQNLRNRLPMLEARVNSYVSPALKGFHLLTMTVVVLVVLDAWHAFNLGNWVASDNGRAVILAVVHVAIILVIATLVWTAVASIIEHRLSLTPGPGRPSEREKTLLSLFRNAALVVIVTLTILVVLSQIGINIAPLIAGAGVAGLAIGFGAQKLVQDVITGVFIQLENGMNQNDVVEVAGIFGTVEKITIRSVGIRTLDGGFHMIPFSSVDKVSNHTRDFAYHYGEYAIAYRENVDDAVYQLERAFEELMQDKEMAAAVLEDISIPGVTSLHERGYNIRVLIKTVPGMQWAVQRAFNRLVKKHFTAAGIELPYPHTVLYFGQDKDGNTPPIPIRELGGMPGAAPG
jgi:small-conductance mechanosensitive channel